MSSPRDPMRPTEAELAAELPDAVAALRAVEDEDRELLTPPAALWDRIADALAGEGVAAEPAPAPRTAAQEEPAEVHDLDAARRRRAVPTWLALGAAAVAAVVVGTVAVLAAIGDSGGDVRATATLATLDDEEPVGTAELVDDHGRLTLVVDFPEREPDGGYFELWLINEDVTGLISLGPVEPGRTEVPLPEAVDPGAFPIVDVSVEPPDGDPAHSGNSVVRGHLEHV